MGTNGHAAGWEKSIIVGADPALHAALAELAGAARVACFAGLPGTGKSLLIHQLAHLAHQHGRTSTVLQWDTARPPFVASLAGRRYPQVEGVTHGMIRVAVGRWARHALAAWHAAHPGAEHLLIAETPLVGHRLIELARPADDAAEPLLSDSRCRFVVPVPSRAVRRHLEAERERRMRSPQHDRENEDAPPHVLRDLWQQLSGVAVELGVPPGATPQVLRAGVQGAGSPVLPGAAAAGADVPYDPDIYRAVYMKVLHRRNAQAIALDVILPSSSLSAYDFQVPLAELLPDEADTDRYIAEAEQAFPEGAHTAAGAAGTPAPQGRTLKHEIERWYD